MRIKIALPLSCLALLVLPAALAAQTPGQPPLQNSVNGASARTEDGFGLFQQRCLTCHGKAEYERAPSPSALREMSPEHIYAVLSSGIMFPVVGKQMSDQDRKLVSESISGRLLGSAVSGDSAQMPNHCAAGARLTDIRRAPAWNGWGADANNTRYQPPEAARLSTADIKSLQLKWAFGFPDGSSAYAQPSIVAHRVFVGADTGYVYSLDAKSGCIYWSFAAKAGVRNAMSVAKLPNGTLAVFFGDVKANVYGLNADSGKLLWINHVEDHLTDRVTAAPAYHEGVLYVPISSWEEYRARDPTYSCCTSRGAVAALDAASGRTLWKTYVIAAPPAAVRTNSLGVQQFAPAGGSVWNTPTVDPKHHAVYFGTGDATTFPAPDTSDAVMALDMASGAVLWSYQVHKNDAFLVGCGVPANKTENCPSIVGPDWDIPGSVILREVAGRPMLIAGTKPGDILALDPDRRGALIWRTSVNGGALAGDGPDYPTGTRKGVQWGGAASADTVYYGMTDGGLAALALKDGQRRWFAPLNRDRLGKADNSAAVTALKNAVFVGGTDGTLFAVSTEDQSILWSFDTAREFDTVNKVKAKGGSIGAPGATVADGMVYIASGYATTSGEPGNVLLAFAPRSGK